MILDAIGSRKRLEILRLLSKGERCVSEIMEELKMDGKTAKHHLNVLERSGIIESRIEGRKKVYRLVKEIRIEISPPPKRKFMVVISSKRQA